MLVVTLLIISKTIKLSHAVVGAIYTRTRVLRHYGSRLKIMGDKARNIVASEVGLTRHAM